MPQFLMGIVHFFVTSLKARYTDLNTASSLWKESLFSVYFLILPLRFSIRLVVADLDREVKKDSELFPIVFPAFNGIIIFAAPLAFKGLQCSLSSLTGWSFINILHISGKLPFVFPHHIPATVADLMHHTDLSSGLRKDITNGLRIKNRLAS